MTGSNPDNLAEGHWARAQRDHLVRFVSARLRNDHSLCEDVVQETLIRLVDYARRHQVGNLAALARRIASNLIVDHVRRRQRLPTQVLDDCLPSDDPLQEQVLMHKQRLDRFREVIDRMPPLRREVLIRRRVHGQSHEDIARALDLSLDAVEKHISRAMRQLYEDTQAGH